LFSSFSDSIFLASSVTTGLAGATFSVDEAVSNFPSLVCGADSPVVWTVG